MSNSASESDFSSSEDDEDYVPSGDEDSFDDLEGVVDEDNTEESSKQKKKQSTKGNSAAGTKSRKGWSALAEVSRENAVDDEIQDDKLEDRLSDAKTEELEKKKEVEKKKKADDLWSSFLSDVGQKPKPKLTESQIGQCDKITSTTAKSGVIQNTTKASCDEPSPTQPNGNKRNDSVTITKVFDFAGEEIRVTKEVAASSREAKNFLKKDTQEKEDNSTSGSSSGLSSILAPKPGGPPGIKRPGGGLGSVLGQIGKKQKISTLEKSRLDWMSFKKAEGIEEDVKIHNKGKKGYVDGQRFLERADHRQYEIERNLRMSQSKTTR